MKRILVISDMHIPYHHQDSFAFLEAIKKEFKPINIDEWNKRKTIVGVWSNKHYALHLSKIIFH